MAVLHIEMVSGHSVTVLWFLIVVLLAALSIHLCAYGLDRIGTFSQEWDAVTSFHLQRDVHVAGEASIDEFTPGYWLTDQLL